MTRKPNLNPPSLIFVNIQIESSKQLWEEIALPAYEAFKQVPSKYNTMIATQMIHELM